MLSLPGEAPRQGADCKANVHCCTVIFHVVLSNIFLVLFQFSVNVWMDSKPTLRVGAAMPIKCLDNSLKTVVLKSYAGLRAHINFAKFFVERARALNVMKLYCITECTHRWVQKQHTLLNI